LAGCAPSTTSACRWRTARCWWVSVPAVPANRPCCAASIIWKHRPPARSGSTACGSRATPRTSTPFGPKWAWSFSSFNLFPHLTALDNIVIAPEDRPQAQHRRGQRVRPSAAGARRIPEKENQVSGQLVGWDSKQRVAIARALAMNPRSCCSMNRRRRSIPEMIKRSPRRDAGAGEGRIDDVVVTHEMGLRAQTRPIEFSSWITASLLRAAPPTNSQSSQRRTHPAVPSQILH